MVGTENVMSRSPLPEGTKVVLRQGQDQMCSWCRNRQHWKCPKYNPKTGRCCCSNQPSLQILSPRFAPRPPMPPELKKIREIRHTLDGLEKFYGSPPPHGKLEKIERDP